MCYESVRHVLIYYLYRPTYANSALLVDLIPLWLLKNVAKILQSCYMLLCCDVIRDCGERLVQILDDVQRVLSADRQADELLQRIN